MKQKFKMVGRNGWGDAKTAVTVEIDTNKFYLTAPEAREYKRKLQNAVFKVLREADYDVTDIKTARP